MREEEKNQSSRKLNSFFKKRWVFPAIYLVTAAVLISGIVWFQMGVTDNAKMPDVTDKGKELTGQQEEPVIEVNQSFENIAMPVKNESEAKIVTQYYDPNASADKQEQALIVAGNKYIPNMGLDIAMEDGESFEVTAAISGKVAAVRTDSLLGNVIEVEHEKGILTVYQSVQDIKVKVGDAVKQGDVLALASTSELNRDAKTHVHFEIRKENVALNPLDFFGQSVTVIGELEQEAEMTVDESGASETDAQQDLMETESN